MSSKYSWLGIAGLLLAACGKQTSRPLERIAAPPLENLSGNAELDWISSASTPLLVMKTAGAPGRIVLGVNAEREAAAVRASQVLRGYYDGKGGTVRLHAALFDAESNRMVREFDEQGAPGDVLDRLAAAIKEGTVAAATRSAAMEAYGRSVHEKDAAVRRTRLEEALRSDPGFTPAAIALAQLQTPQEAVATLQAAIGRHQDGWERSRLQLALATVQREPAAVLKAMENCLRFAPNDTDMARGLGDALVNRHRYAEGVQWLEKAAALEPEQVQIWNLLAYANSYARNLDKAKQSLEGYRKAAPQDPNAFDTAGEIYWAFGQFREAETNFLEAQKIDPLFLGGLEFAKAAMARFLSGDEKGADQMFGRYMESRRSLKDPLADLRAAHWLYLTGRKQPAKEAIGKLAATTTEAGVLAQAFLALWQLQEGDAAAAGTAQQAMGRARTPAAATQAGLVMLLAQPRASAEEWNSRIQRAVGPGAPPALRRLVLVYALTLGKHFKEARTLLEAMYNETPPSGSDEIRMLLALARLETGDKAGAKVLLERYALPPNPGDTLYASLWFPQFQAWRKAVGL